VISWATTGLLVTALLTTFSIFLHQARFTNEISPAPPTQGHYPVYGATRPRPGLPLTTTIPAVVVIFAVDLGVLWLLNHKIRPQGPKSEHDKAQFHGKFTAKLKGIASTVSVAAVGSLGSFLSIVAVTIAAILVLGRFG